MAKTYHTTTTTTTTTTTMNKMTTADGKDDYRHLVLGTREDNGYHDSYWYSSIWDLNTRSIIEVMTNTTAFAGGATHTSPAIEPVKAVAQEWLLHQKLWKAYNSIEDNALRCVWEKGDWLMVVRGRKFPKGTMVRVLTVRPVTKNPWSGAMEHTVLVTDTKGSTQVIKDEYLSMPEYVMKTKKDKVAESLPTSEQVAKLNSLADEAEAAVLSIRTAK